jgi:hypothetical protein
LITLSPLLLGSVKTSQLPGLSGTIMRFCWGAAAVSIACFIATLPVLIHHFNQIYLFGLFANLFAVSLMSLSMWTACAGFVFQFVSTPLGTLFMHGAEFFLRVMKWGAGLVHFVPWSVQRFAMPYTEVYVIFTIFCLGVLLVKKDLLRRYCLVVLPVCVMITAATIYSHAVSRKTSAAWLTMGNTRLFAVRWPDNRAWLFDIGEEMPKSEAYNSAIFPWKSQFMGCRIEKVILPRWKQNGVHFLSPLFENEKAANLFVCDSGFARNDDFLSFLNAYKRTITFVHPGDTLHAGDKRMCTIFPRRGAVSMQERLAFSLRINGSTVFIPIAKGSISENRPQRSLRRLIMGTKGNFLEYTGD